MPRPTIKDIAEARENLLTGITHTRWPRDLPKEVLRDIHTPLAATEPPTDDEIRAAFSELWSTPEIYYEESKSKIVIAVIRKLLGPVKP
jgi:hypothetical protein